jgi:simple sugar transport system ATP-binding protein
MKRGEPLLSMRGITKVFPGQVRANDGVDLEVRAGEIHALLGENGAGKTTLMNILSGLFRADRGEIRIRGEPVQFKTPRQAIEMGIGMVHQHFMLVSQHTVSENVALGLKDLPLALPLRRIERRIEEFAARYDLFVDPDARIWQLSAGERQKVEIIKVLIRGAVLLILDEPTSVLTPEETEKLFAILNRMKSEGKAIVFITHKLGEVLEVADRITILRRGAVTASLSSSQIRGSEMKARAELAMKMVGREVILEVLREPVSTGDVVLRVQNLRVIDDRGTEVVADVSFTVRRGEIFGVVGVAGNGQGPLIEAITGLRPANGGNLVKGGEIGYIPEDRLHMGSVPELSVAENSVLTGYRQTCFSGTFLLNLPSIRKWAEALVAKFRVLTPGVDTPVKQLSGGNLQKLILARELSKNSPLIVAEQPTQGLDVGSIEYVWDFLLQQRKSSAILMVSGDLGEVLSLSDRIGVMYKGRMTVFERPFDDKLEEIGFTMTGMATESSSRQ